MDYLEIREDSGIGKLINTFCGTNAEPVQTPKKLWIKFKSDNEGAGKGFRAHFQVIGGDELSGPVGTITSPLYPIPYKQSYTMWRITVEFGSIIRIDITDIYINNFDTGINSLKVYIKTYIFQIFDSRRKSVARHHSNTYTIPKVLFLTVLLSGTILLILNPSLVLLRTMFLLFKGMQP